ncbi:MAG: energy transducer TonB [Myxococcales bacterium]
MAASAHKRKPLAPRAQRKTAASPGAPAGVLTADDVDAAFVVPVSAAATEPLSSGQGTETSGSALVGESGAGTAGSGTDLAGSSGGGLARPYPEAPTSSLRCPWPPDGEDLDGDSERVVVRVHVGAHGRMLSGEVVSSSSKLFSEAALSCARNVLFEPARDASGRAVPARSEPITVRFERWRMGISGR